MNLKLLTFLSLILGQSLFAQKQLTFTKEQMLSDFDTLVNTIYKTSPQIRVKRDLWHYDFLSTAKMLRKKIDTVSSDLSYYILLLGILNSAQDLHTSTWGEQQEWAKKQENDYLRIRNGKFKVGIPHILSNGKYFVTHPFILKNDTITIGSEITKINGIKISEYLKQNTWVRNGFSYDFPTNSFGCLGFHKNLETIFKDSFNLTIKPPGKKAVTCNINVSLPINYLPEKTYTDTTRAEYWDEVNVFYIRLTEMNEKFKDYLSAKITENKSKLNSSSKIIIDIRNNGGGNDNVWTDLYSALIDKPIYYSLKLAVTEYTSQRNEFYSKRKKYTEGVLGKYNFYTIVDEKDTIEPSKTSVRFSGNIYILSENVYSSAGSAVSVASANLSDNIISVGRPTGQFLGIGFAPLIFQLPNTKLNYRVAPSMEITNAKKLQDLMQDKVEITVPFDINYYKQRFESNISPTSKEFLIQYDPFIKAVLSQ